MKRNARWIVIAIAVGIAGWGLGRFSRPEFELRVEVGESGTRLTAVRGCRWDSASYRGEGGSYAFEVTGSGVRTAGTIVAER